MAQKKYVSLDKLGLYDKKIKKYLADADAVVLADAKKYTDDSVALCDAVGTAATEAGKVQTKLDEEVTRAKGREDEIAGLVTKAQGDVDALAGKVGEVADGSTVVGMIDAVDAIADANAADIVTIKGQIDALEKGTYDDTEVRGLITANADAINALEETHATDKSTLEGAIALKADQTALDAVSGVANAAVKQADYDTKVAALEAEDARIVGLVEAEAERAANAESGLEGRIETMEAFWEAAKADGDEGNVIDTLKEIQEYIAGDETGASEMLASIQKNAKDIADHVATDHDFAGADAALKTELEGKINSKADNSALTELAGRVTTAEGEIDTLQTDLGTAQAAIEALQTAVGDGGSVDEMIDSAIETAMGEEEARVDALLANKVDKVDGKGLSTNDLTNELKAQYDAAYTHSQAAHAPADAQKNIIETVKVNGAAVTVTDKAVDISVPTDNAQLTNGAGYLVASDIANKADKATTLEGYGIADAYTSAQTDTAIANAMANFVECSETEINDLFA